MKMQMTRFEVVFPTEGTSLEEYMAEMEHHTHDTLEMPAISRDIAETAIETVRPQARKEGGK